MAYRIAHHQSINVDSLQITAKTASRRRLQVSEAKDRLDNT